MSVSSARPADACVEPMSMTSIMAALALDIMIVSPLLAMPQKGLRTQEAKPDSRRMTVSQVTCGLPSAICDVESRRRRDVHDGAVRAQCRQRAESEFYERYIASR